MWATPEGKRTLEGAEHKLFATAAGLLAHWLDELDESGVPLETGVHLFDALALEQKLAMLDFVSALYWTTMHVPQSSRRFVRQPSQPFSDI